MENFIKKRIIVTHITQIWNNGDLCGHCFTQLPTKLWKFATKDRLVSYSFGDDHGFFGNFDNVTWVSKVIDGKLDRTEETRTSVFPFNVIEFGVRRIGGSFLTVASGLTVAPLGFAIKIIHLVGIYLTGKMHERFS